MEGQPSSCFFCISCHTIAWQMAAFEMRGCVLCIVSQVQKRLRVFQSSLKSCHQEQTHHLLSPSLLRADLEL